MLRPTMTHLVRAAAERFGQRVALTLPGEGQYTYGQLDDLAGRFAGGLAALGVGAGDRVVLYLPNGWQWIAAYHAIARLGAVVVPANILLSAQEVSYMASDAQAVAVILPAERNAEVSLDAAVLRIALGRAEGAHFFDEVLDGVYRLPVERDPEDLFTIGYTSGTTGKPKGAMLTHRCLFASLSGTATVHVRHEHDVVLSCLPFPHVYGNIVMNAMFLAGTRLVATPKFDPGTALALIASERVTLFEGVPTMYYQLLAHADIGRADLSSLTRCTVGGQTMPVAKLEAVVRRFGCPLLELWGMTELAGPATSHSPYWAPRPGSIGLPFPGMQARIADLDEPGRDAAPGTPGELLVRGPLVTTGYYNNPAATAQALDAQGWLATGDIAYADADGYLFVVDRKKDMIITAGYNVYPAELEQVVAMHPDVVMTAVAGFPDEEKGEIAVAFVVRRQGAALDEATLLSHCRRHLAAYKVPRSVRFVQDLPKTSTGKLMRRALADIA
ncbi:AMP-binding protein [Pseudoxanthomonas winnipegensis]|uniref:AMP-binding protein n=1 Tax=Pseudoxanthomonas winnipegensis TaxID=2480810 RepID=UPI00103EA3DC|nr:AMP-binding protein [Pseudoxanthomonas winnipegensis]TBV72851.1 AMP-dependent synthetase [Pseudoxanthomonas winnipegensis]